MIFTKTKRVIKGGFINFWRNSWVSLASMLVVIITLFTIGSLVFFRVAMESILVRLQDKVDISVYFKTSAGEDDILAIKDSVLKLAEVKSAEYVSAEKALEDFKTRHQDNAALIQSVEELDENPLGAVLNIKAKEISQFGSVAKFLESKNGPLGDSIIDKINYFQNKKVIDRLTVIIQSAKKIGLVISIVLVVISFLVTFNTIRLAIYSSREEIEVMKLVGASNRFASGPFIVEGMMYGFFSAIITMMILYPATVWFDPQISIFFPDISLWQYYVSNFVQIFVLLLAVGVILCGFSSFIAVRRYLKV